MFFVVKQNYNDVFLEPITVYSDALVTEEEYARFLADEGHHVIFLVVCPG